MYFNSIDFAIFFPIVFTLYWQVFRKNTDARNGFLIITSYFFYACWNWKFLALIIISSFVDFIIGKKLSLQANVTKRKILLAISIITNLGFLGFFKYSNFFIESFASVFTLFGFPIHTSTLNIILPVGISFYTFQTLSYTLDIYFKKLEPTNDALSFFAFVSFFPQLVAGPIERAKHLIPQFQEEKKLNYEKLRYGILLIASGLFKKIVIADRLAIYIDNAYEDIGQINGFPALIAVVFFAFQLYFDFSGYSEIAIGTARILDFKLMENFRRPYLATSFSDFWKRWHISLSSWFKDYLYIPLGGSRKGKWKTIRNVLLVFALSGLWHGASWNFIIWGSINAGFLILFDKLIFKLNPKKKICLPVSLFVFLCWSLSLVFFRAQSFSDAISMYSSLGLNNFSGIYDYGFNIIEMRFIVCLLGIIVVLEIMQENINNFYMWFIKKYIPVRWGIYLIIVLFIILFGAYGEGISDNSFIYFQF
jgi:D-alanyl-lipoteichoic acid acyltransferase DltB (MBOAT superfamily)